jgi:cell division inhibitor SulA
MSLSASEEASLKKAAEREEKSKQNSLTASYEAFVAWLKKAARGLYDTLVAAGNLAAAFNAIMRIFGALTGTEPVQIPQPPGRIERKPDIWKDFER